MATTVMNGNDCFKNGNDCFKWQRPFTKGKIAAARHCGTAFLVKQGKQSPSGNLNISLSSFFEARHSWKAALLFLYFRIFIIVN